MLLSTLGRINWSEKKCISILNVILPLLRVKKKKKNTCTHDIFSVQRIHSLGGIHTYLYIIYYMEPLRVITIRVRDIRTCSTTRRWFHDFTRKTN